MRARVLGGRMQLCWGGWRGLVWGDEFALLGEEYVASSNYIQIPGLK